MGRMGHIGHMRQRKQRGHMRRMGYMGRMGHYQANYALPRSNPACTAMPLIIKCLVGAIDQSPYYPDEKNRPIIPRGKYVFR